MQDNTEKKSAEEVVERPAPPWINEIPDGAFITYDPTYPTGSYFDRFNKGNFSDMKYYFYDPTEHGYPKKDDYPLMIFLHGTGNALVGDLCINYTGAEMYASDEYQKDLGGAYILVPVANEVKDKEGNTTGFWDESYSETIVNLVDHFIMNHTNGIKEKILLGNSSGARFTFTLAKTYPESFDILVPVGTSDIPDDDILDNLSDLGVTLFYAISKRDEFNPYDTEVAPRIDKIREMKNSFIFTPDWTYNGDGGIASINFGFEMGQHCLMNGVQNNLKFDDGTPMYDSLPRGFTGWLSDELKRRKMENE